MIETDFFLKDKDTKEYRERERETDRQTYRQTDRQTNRQTDRRSKKAIPTIKLRFQFEAKTKKNYFDISFTLESFIKEVMLSFKKIVFK